MPLTYEVLTIPVMIAETISLRILAFPKVLATLGLLPYDFLSLERKWLWLLHKLTWRSGIAVIIGVGVLTTYTGLVIGDFKCRYPQAHSMADAGTILWGRIGCGILGAAQLIFFVFIMGSHILTFSHDERSYRLLGLYSSVFRGWRIAFERLHHATTSRKPVISLLD